MRHPSLAPRPRCRLGFDDGEGGAFPPAAWPGTYFWPAYHPTEGAGLGGAGPAPALPPAPALAPETSASIPPPAAGPPPAAAGGTDPLPVPAPTRPAASLPVPATEPTCPRRDPADWAGTRQTTLAVVFTDVVDSTGLWNALGNERMARVLHAHFDRGHRLAEGHHGLLIRTTGDSLLLAFRTAAAALDFTLAYAARTGHVLIRIRAGIHVGPVRIEDGDVYGATVNYAARVVGKAGGSEIWVSGRAHSDVEEERARAHAALRWLPHRHCTLKGFPGKHLLWSVLVPEAEA